MRIEDIITRRKALEKELKLAVATMERKDKIYELRVAMLENQKRCPHTSDKFNWELDGHNCPYCGFALIDTEWREDCNDKGY